MRVASSSRSPLEMVEANRSSTFSRMTPEQELRICKKGLVLSVDVGDEVLGAFGQVQNSLKIDDLAAGSLYGGVLLGQQFQITQLFLGK